MVSKAQIKRIASLQQKKYRLIHKQFVVEGKKMVEEALQSDFNIVEIVGFKEIIDELDFNHKFEITVNDYKKISTLKTPPGILAVIEMKDYSDDVHLNQNVNFYLEDLSDPGNFGTIIRTADWFGYRTIYCSPKTVDVYNPKVLQATMGSIFRVNIVVLSPQKFVTSCQKQKITLYIADMQGENYQNVTSSKLAIIIGSEANGASESLKKLISDKITIAKKGSGESLNASIAAALMMARFA